MDIMKKSFFLQLTFVFMLSTGMLICTGFTCQKKYPPPLVESNSETPTETSDSPNTDLEKPADKTDN